jgi:predicted nucleic acid-binding protein
VEGETPSFARSHCVGDPTVTQQVAALEGAVLISVVTRLELEGGVYREPAHASIRRARLDPILSAIEKKPSPER